MQSAIAQIAAISIYGNYFLRKRYLPAFYPANTAFMYCKKVFFVPLEGEDGELRQVPYAQDPTTWFYVLAAHGVKGLRMHYRPLDDPDISDRMAVAFVGGGGRWLIETVKPGSSDYWEARWKLVRRSAPDNRIWEVAYGCVAPNQESAPIQRDDLSECVDGLKEVLCDIVAFARRHGLERFAQCFERGQGCLRSDLPLQDTFHRGVAPAGFLPLAACRLLGAAQAAWVFGGMGSWNDLGFEAAEHRVYEALSDSLYNLLNDAIVKATNTAYKPD